MKINYILSVALGLAMLPMLSGCDSNDPIVQTPLATPTGTTYTSTFKSIECSWDRVEGATNYGYEWLDADGNLITRSVTLEPSLSFTNLNYSSVYYLNVWAYGAYGSANGTSATATYEFRTDDLEPLPTPVITVKKSSATKVQFSWTGDATLTNYYEYTLYRPDGSVQSTNKRAATSPSITFTLNSEYTGTYTFTLKAVVKADYTYPNDKYCDSELATATYDFGTSSTAP